MPHFTALAAEILSMVVTDLSDDLDALRALSLTAKMFLPHTRPLLLHNISCHADPVTVDFSSSLAWLGTQAGGGITRVAKRLTLVGRVVDDGGDAVVGKVDPCVAQGFMALLPFLEEFRVREVVWDACDMAHIHVNSLTPFPNIRVIDLSDVTVCTPHLSDDIVTLFRGTTHCDKAIMRRL